MGGLAGLMSSFGAPGDITSPCREIVEAGLRLSQGGATDGVTAVVSLARSCRVFNRVGPETLPGLVETGKSTHHSEPTS